MHTVSIGPYVIEAIDGHKRRVGAASVDDFQYHLKLERSTTTMWCMASLQHPPSMQGDIKSYRAVILSQNPSAFDPPGKKQTYSR